MLDDVERRRFLVDPAGKHPLPAVVGPLHVELDEGAGQLLGFPRRGRLAGAKPDDRILDPDRSAGTQDQVADDPVALVEEAEHRDPLRHGRHSGKVPGRLRQADGLRGALLPRSGFAFAPGGGEQGDRHDYRCDPHAQSGVQGW